MIKTTSFLKSSVGFSESVDVVDLIDISKNIILVQFVIRINNKVPV